MRLIVTRPGAQAAAWVERLHELGVDAVALPLLGIAPPRDVEPVRLAWAALPACRLAVFVSPNAVEQFFALRPAGCGWPPGCAAGATGPGTAAALRGAGLDGQTIVQPPADSPRFDSEALWSRIEGWGWAGRRVLVVRGEDGRDWLAETLRGHGAAVDFVAAYRRLKPELDEAGRVLLASACSEPDRHCWLFSSSEAASWLPELAPGADWSRARALATHPRIAETVRRIGFGRVELTGPLPAEVAAALRTPSIQSAAP